MTPLNQKAQALREALENWNEEMVGYGRALNNSEDLYEAAEALLAEMEKESAHTVTSDDEIKKSCAHCTEFVKGGGTRIQRLEDQLEAYLATIKLLEKELERANSESPSSSSATEIVDLDQLITNTIWNNVILKANEIGIDHQVLFDAVFGAVKEMVEQVRNDPEFLTLLDGQSTEKTARTGDWSTGHFIPDETPKERKP